MSHQLRDFLLYSIVLTIMFCDIPQVIQLNFLGSVMGGKLSIYPLLVGLLISLYYWKKTGYEISSDSRKFLLFISTLSLAVFISLLHGLIVYPYYSDILNGPVDQIQKLPKVYSYLQHYNVPITEQSLLKVWIKVWMVARPLKSFILEIIWTFGVSYMIYCWYKKDWKSCFCIVRKGLIVSVIAIVLYSALDILYLSGMWGAETLLSFLNPVVHEIKSNDTWWPPLLWPGQLRSLFAEPSYFGIFAAFAMPWLWYSICTTKNRGRKIGYVVLFVVYTICLFFTKARTANALFMGELFLFGLASIAFRKELLKKYCLILICAVVAFGFSTIALTYMPGSPEKAEIISSKNNLNQDAMKQYFDDNLGSLASSSKRSNRARYSVLAADLGIGKDHLLLGVGRSLRNAYIPQYLPDNAFQSDEIMMWINNQKTKGIMKSGFPALGEYSSRFAETGILGLIIYLFPALLLLYKIIKAIRNHTITFTDRLKYICLGISFIGILASGLGDNINITCVYWILLGIGYAMCFGQKKYVDNKEI